MKRIKELLVLEGKHDEARIRQLYDCDIVLTKGLALDEETLEYIAAAAENNGVIVFTDPDGPGEKIRKKIIEKVPKARHCFIAREKAIGKRNVGIEYGQTDAIIEALENTVTFSKGNESLSRKEYLDLGLMQNTEKRKKLSAALHLGFCNNKTLFKRLNMMNVSADQIRKILDES
ncbi:MAG: ribonuclease M5 [Erysipelotrichaceae bacterium]|nr:ribonuclease M5 [Erysipelotrichaceae bacterium]